MRPSNKTTAFFLSCAAALLLCGCGGSSPDSAALHQGAAQEPGASRGPAVEEAAELAFGLPSPDEVLRSAASCGEERIIKAGPLNPSPLLQPRSRVQAVGPDSQWIRFAPDFGESGAAFEDISFLIHYFSFDDYPFGGTQIRYDWEQAPTDASKLYVGLANWDKGSYSFFQTATPELLETGLANFDSFVLEEQANSFILVTLMIGESDAILRGIHVGNDPEPLIEIEPNNTREEAMLIDVEEFGCLEGLIGGTPGGGEDDWYAFEVTQTGDFLLELQCESAIDNLNLFVYNPQNKLLLSSENPDNNESVNYRLLDLGTYYLHVKRLSGSLSDAAAYSFFSTFEPVTLVFHEVEPNNDAFNPQVLPALPINNFSGRLGSRQTNVNDFADYFKVNVPEPGELSVDLSFKHSQANVDLYLTGSTGTLFFAMSESVDDNEAVNFQFNEPGDYIIYLRYRHPSSSPFVADYLMDITLVPGGGYTEQEPNNSIEEPQQINLPLSDLVGGVGSFGDDGGDDDYFGFSVSRAGELSVSLESNPQLVNVDLAILRSDGGVLGSALTTDELEQINIDLPSEGRYYIWVVRNDSGGEGGDYILSASFIQGLACNGGQEAEPNNGTGVFNDMPPVDICDFSGILGGEVIENFDGWDEFRIDVGDSGLLEIDLIFSHALNDLDLWLTTESGQLLEKSEGDVDNESISYYLDEPGFYRIIGISQGVSFFAPYTIDVNFSADAP